MRGHSDVVYNRPDCPYGCGEPLPDNLRWQRTPCPRCGRPLFPLNSVHDDEGNILWPPAHIPRPPRAGQSGITVWYVVRENEASDGVSISHANIQRRVGRSEERSCTIVIAVLIFILAVAVVAVWFVVFGPR